MKFVIIEDRIGRLEHFEDFNLRLYNNVEVLTGSNFDKLIFSIESGNTADLDLYNCIAAHRSALSSKVRDILKEYCKINKKPLIFFSGGISSTVFKDLPFPFLHINSKDFYSSNLKLFIDDCEANSRINLLVLQFGNRWKLSLLLSLRNNISVAQNKNSIKHEILNSNIEDSELIKRVRDLKINSLIRFDLSDGIDRGISLDDEFSKISPEQIQEIKSFINNLIIKIA